MAREIRVTIDDDEVFERMRARKRSLDLSWEDVLHRGLRQSEPGDIGDRLERRIRQRVEESLETAFGIDDAGSVSSGVGGVGDERESAGREPPEPPDPSEPPEPPGTPTGGMDAEMESLANAEDATLRFPFLPDTPGNRVPLRVRLETTADGLDVTVVTVRTGKSVADENAFDRDARPKIAAALADGETARLTLADGAEQYRVVPTLSWRATENGPTVTEASIREVRFDA